MRLIYTYKLIILILLFQNCNAQQLIENTKLNLQLRDGTELNCYKSYSMNGDNANTYYYLPTNIHFSINQLGDKSYSLIVYRDENEQIKGAIMHWLLTWGLNVDQKNEANILLKTKVGKDSNLVGAVLAESVESQDFKILGKNELSTKLNAALVNKGKVPLVPNSKIAIAFKFTKEEAHNINELFTNNKEQKDTSILMHFLVRFKASNTKTYIKNVTISQNLQTLLKH